MKVHCPCDKIAEAKVVNGIIVYEHEDGTSCKLLNKFYNDKCVSYAWHLCKKAICNNDHKEFNIYMCKDNEDVLNKLYEYIRFANKQELILVLKFLFKGSEIKADLQKIILTKFAEDYGVIAYRNVKAIRSKNFTNDTLLNSVLNLFLPKAKEKFKMINIESDVNIECNTAKQNIVNDLARSFLLDKAIKDSALKNAIKSFSR